MMHPLFYLNKSTEIIRQLASKYLIISLSIPQYFKYRLSKYILAYNDIKTVYIINEAAKEAQTFVFRIDWLCVSSHGLY